MRPGVKFITKSGALIVSFLISNQALSLAQQGVISLENSDIPESFQEDVKDLCTQSQITDWPLSYTVRHSAFFSESPNNYRYALRPFHHTFVMEEPFRKDDLHEASASTEEKELFLELLPQYIESRYRSYHYLSAAFLEPSSYKKKFFLNRFFSAIVPSSKKILRWARQKDATYTHDDPDALKLRYEWEQMIGMDIFFPYYKYKEAQKYIKSKTTVHCFKFKATPAYENGQLQLRLSRKF